MLPHTLTDTIGVSIAVLYLLEKSILFIKFNVPNAVGRKDGIVIIIGIKARIEQKYLGWNGYQLSDEALLHQKVLCRRTENPRWFVGLVSGSIKARIVQKIG